MKSISESCRKLNSKLVDLNGTLLLTICPLFAVISARAGYIVDSHVETTSGTNYYTWTVHNEDQSWGLDGLAIEVPVETRILAHTIPPPYSNPDRTAHWIMQERHDAEIDAHDGRPAIRAPRPGMKWLLWWGNESPSVYPAGTSVSFSVATDSSVGPGVVNASAATYTPQNNPHWYLSWHGQTIGPSITTSDASPGKGADRDSIVSLPDMRSTLVTNLQTSATSQEANNLTPLPAPSVAMHAAITVEGEVGRTYAIQYNSNLSDPAGWHGLANVILTTPKQTCYDPRPGSNPQRFYRIVPGPIPLP